MRRTWLRCLITTHPNSVYRYLDPAPSVPVAFPFAGSTKGLASRLKIERFDLEIERFNFEIERLDFKIEPFDLEIP